MSDVDQRLKAGVVEGLTAEKLDAMKRRIGMPFVDSLPSFNRTAAEDTIYHFAKGNGDDNPLWCDPDYGKTTRWGSVIAPPLYINTLARNEVSKLPEDMQHLRGDPLRGIHAFYAGGEWEFFEPVYPGDTASMLDYLDAVEERPSKFGGGKAFLVVHAKRYQNGRGQVVAVNRRTFYHAARDSSAKAAKEKVRERKTWSAEDIAAIDAVHAAYQRRGAEPRYWEDVTVGDELPLIVKGPMTITDMVGAFVGFSFGPFGMSPFRMDYLNRQRVPRFYVPNQWGIPEGAGSCHWDDWWAQKVGAMAAYDFGMMRDYWATEVVTAWMGDDAFLRKLASRVRGFNYMGDAQWVRGSVASKSRDGDDHTVTIDVTMTNQRDEQDYTATVTVALPSRERGPVRLPNPPRDLPRGLDDLRRRLSASSGGASGGG